MNDLSSKDLLGYMLGALEPVEHQEIEELVEQDPELKEELLTLRHQVAFLDELDPPGVSPAGLARRTCERIAAQPAVRLEQPTPGARDQRRRWFSSRSDHAGDVGRRSLMDYVIVAVVLMLLAAIVLPAINSSRHQSRVLACQDNLRKVGTGLLEYSTNSGGKYIALPDSGNMSFAGIYAPTLLDAGYVDDSSSFMCAGIGNAEGRAIPAMDEIRNADDNSLHRFQKVAGGDFAYSLGMLKNGKYDAGFNQGRSDYVLLADSPSVKLPGRASNNHGGHGQNVFFEDGHIQFLESPEYMGDALYENDWGSVAPGAHGSDIVVAPSATRLLLQRYRFD